jgi:hypothetical protein
MLLFIFAREKRISCIKFIKNAAERPHVDASVVGYPEHDFWGTVKA